MLSVLLNLTRAKPKTAEGEMKSPISLWDIYCFVEMSVNKGEDQLSFWFFIQLFCIHAQKAINRVSGWKSHFSLSRCIFMQSVVLTTNKVSQLSLWEKTQVHKAFKKIKRKYSTLESLHHKYSGWPASYHEHDNTKEKWIIFWHSMWLYLKYKM